MDSTTIVTIWNISLRPEIHNAVLTKKLFHVLHLLADLFQFDFDVYNEGRGFQTLEFVPASGDLSVRFL